MRNIVRWKNPNNSVAITGDVYYLNNSGSDSNSGTRTDSAWLTVVHAESVMQNGDVVLTNTSADGEIPIARKKSEFGLLKMGGVVTNNISNNSTINITTSRTTGVAPLSVHYYAEIDGSEDASGDFHHYDYTWNFADTGAGTWGTNSKSKNSAKGALTTHIFETAGTYNASVTVKQGATTIGIGYSEITVSDPDTIYSTTKTTCVNNAGDSDFTGALTGSTHVSTDDLSTVVSYAAAGQRVLFKRGGAWSTTGLTWPNNAGPVTIGAYGAGSGSPDTLGIYSNNPQITVTGTGTFMSLSSKQDWRIMDLSMIDNTRAARSFNGAESMQRQLFLRLKTVGFLSGITISHWNNIECMSKDQMVIASCDLSGGYYTGLFAGSERLAIMGNKIYDTRHQQVLRVWLTNHGTVQHNILSGASLDEATSGCEALKFHSPNHEDIGVPVVDTNIMDVETDYAIISDNIMGGSGPFPVSLGPENYVLDERITNVIFERNKCIADYGTIAYDANRVQRGLSVWSKYTTVRNNIFDGTGAPENYNGIVVVRSAASPIPAYNEIYNNTIYRSDAGNDIHRAIHIQSTATLTTVRNNLMSFPYATGYEWQVLGFVDDAADTVDSNNLFTDTPHLIDPDNATPLSRNFNLESDSSAINAGYSVPVYEDFDGEVRPNGDYDIGALEYYA
jgi:hypothetical protein